MLCNVMSNCFRFQASIQCVNKLLLRVITNSDKTNCLGGTIKLLQELSENVSTAPSIMKLLMKCIWKLTHLLPDYINEVRVFCPSKGENSMKLEG